MSESSESIEKTIRALFSTQRLAVLSTHSPEQPYASLVVFAATDDLKFLYFATAKTTRKYRHLDGDPRVAMLVDSRSNQESDVHSAIAVTATGKALEINGNERELGVRLYLSKHPYLQDFVRAPSCGLVRVEVATYYLVSRFQHVMELHILP